MENVEFHSVPFSPIKPFPFTLHWFPFSWDYHENHGIHVNSQYRFISDVFHVVLMHGSNVSTTTLHLVHSTGLVVRLQRHPVDDCWRLPSPWNFNASPLDDQLKGPHTRALTQTQTTGYRWAAGNDNGKAINEQKSRLISPQL